MNRPDFKEPSAPAPAPRFSRGSRIFRKLLPARRSTALFMAVAVFLAFAAISCRTVTRVSVKLPDVPGATYIGSKECEQCHEELYKNFQTADHAVLTMGGPNVLNAGCESCHGPASLHSESGGETKLPYSFLPGRPLANGFGANGVTPNARAVENVCLSCHAEVRGEFNLASHHPVPEGRMTCIECHPPHKGSAHRGGSTALKSQDDNCLKCHPTQRGPYVFEHEAMHEGCTSCHGAHGTVNAKMLDGARFESVPQVPFPTGRWRADPHRRRGSHCADSTRHVLDFWLPRSGARPPRQLVAPLLTNHSQPDEKESASQTTTGSAGVAGPAVCGRFCAGARCGIRCGGGR
ncbi:MAG: cytochrome c3 family protein [Verrucomicrobiota bacterium]